MIRLNLFRVFIQARNFSLSMPDVISPLVPGIKVARVRLRQKSGTSCTIRTGAHKTGYIMAGKEGVIEYHSFTKTMPSNRRADSVLSVEMVPLPADVHPASYQAMLIACHHMGMLIDPCRLPRAPYVRRYYPYYQLPRQTYEVLRAALGKRVSLEYE